MRAAKESPANPSTDVDVTTLSPQKHVIAGGLTRPEAASLLGSSIDSVRSRIGAGQVRAHQDAQGRIRISASFTYTPDGAYENDTPDADSLVRMWNELKALQEQLEHSRAEESRLQSELEAAEKALEYTKAEVANLWRVMTTRNLKQAVRKAAGELHETGKVLNLAEQRTRIRSKVADIRGLVRRKRWPWGLVG